MLIFLLLFILTIFIIIGYEIFIYLLKPEKPIRKKQAPPVSVIIPTFNEEKNIVKKLRNLFECDYPKDKMEIFVIDTSTDKTRELAKGFPVNVIKTKKKGKIFSINKGIKEANNDIIILTDADTLLHKNSLKNIVQYLHGDIGGVSGIIKQRNKNNFFLNSKRKYINIDWEIRHREGLIDSVCSLDGKLLVFRKSLIKKIPEDAFADDFEITLILRKKGYRCVVDNKSIVEENRYLTPPKEIKKMRRVIKLSILTSFRHIDVLFNQKYGWYGMLIFPFRRFLNLFLPFLLPFILFYSIIHCPYLILPFILISIFAYKSIPYYLVISIASLLAWFDVITGNYITGAFWEK